MLTIGAIRAFPTDYTDKDRGPCHESLLRSWQVLGAVKEMLGRGDSAETVLAFIEWCYAPPLVNGGHMVGGGGDRHALISCPPRALGANSNRVRRKRLARKRARREAGSWGGSSDG